MADNTNKVTIDAAWFAELYANANGERYAVLEAAYNQVTKERDRLIEKLNYDAKDLLALTNERDELKARLDGDATVNGLSPATQKLLETERRLAAAERCINNIANLFDFDHDYNEVVRNIRAYREKKEVEQ